MWGLFKCFNVQFKNGKIELERDRALFMDECLVFWKKARVLSQEPHKCKEILKILHEEWRSLTKNMKTNFEYL